jgi:hypothetical protein
MRKGHEAIEKEALDSNPQKRTRTGRPRHTWRRTVHNEALEKGKSWKLRGWSEIDGGVLLTPYVP